MECDQKALYLSFYISLTFIQEYVLLPLCKTRTVPMIFLMTYRKKKSYRHSFKEAIRMSSPT